MTFHPTETELDRIEVRKQAAARAHGAAILRSFGGVAPQPVTKAPWFPALRKAVEHATVADFHRIGNSPAVRGRSAYFQRGAALLDAAEQIDRMPRGPMRAALEKRLESAAQAFRKASADGLGRPAGAGSASVLDVPTGDDPFSAQEVEQRRFMEPTADPKAMLSTFAVENPDLRASLTTALLDVQRLPKSERQAYVCGQWTLIPLRRAIERMCEQHNFDQGVFWRLFGMETPPKVEGHGNAQGGEDFGAPHTFTRPGAGDLSWPGAHTGLEQGRGQQRMTEGSVAPSYGYDGKAAGNPWTKLIERSAASSSDGSYFSKSLDRALSLVTDGKLNEWLYQDLCKWRKALALATPSGRQALKCDGEVLDVVRRIRAAATLSEDDKEALAASLMYA